MMEKMGVRVKFYSSDVNLLYKNFIPKLQDFMSRVISKQPALLNLSNSSWQTSRF